jgi:N-acetylglucosaminyl-diphospho-decaprenol L-rhamnosyltransferase
MTSLAISIVSHGQGVLVKLLLDDLAKLGFGGFDSVSIIVTLNIPEDESFLANHSDKVTVVRNLRKLGFGANHNQAFACSDTDYFVVLNPDVRISDSFSAQIKAAAETEWGCMAPIVLSPEGNVEDSARRYPTVNRIFRRVFLNKRDPDYRVKGLTELVQVDWVAGMFLVFRAEVFRALGGFDHRYFMYLEDADICRRANEYGAPVVVNPHISVMHDARRKSLKSYTHFKWHLRSYFRFIFGF